MSGAGGLVKTIILLTYSLGAPATRGRVVNESEWELIVERRAAKNTINYVGVRSRSPAKERLAQNPAQERRHSRQRQFAGDATWPAIIYRGIFFAFHRVIAISSCSCRERARYRLRWSTLLGLTEYTGPESAGHENDGPNSRA